jgi:hypothetical protein
MSFYPFGVKEELGSVSNKLQNSCNSNWRASLFKMPTVYHPFLLGLRVHFFQSGPVKRILVHSKCSDFVRFEVPKTFEAKYRITLRKMISPKITIVYQINFV